jgi:DNA (cytosine-5)-methyltransferase 1
MNRSIKVVDLFAGPGGLGEGFSASGSGLGRDSDVSFKIVLSAEMDPIARETLRLRAFYRQFHGRDAVPGEYFDYLDDPSSRNFEILQEHFPIHWAKADGEALQLELGKDLHDAVLDGLLEQRVTTGSDWVLVGGPPCQAYSLAGRARNKGIKGYLPENDPRHLLYREYLRIIQERLPAVFVMENVKGILSSKLNGKLVFDQILEDLQDPGKALTGASSSKGSGYRLYSMLTGKCISRNVDKVGINPREFILKAEDYGVPQRRHRVFILGVREDIELSFDPILEKSETGSPHLRDLIEDLPKLRSGLSGRSKGVEDTYENWREEVVRQSETLLAVIDAQSDGTAIEADIRDVAPQLVDAVSELKKANRPLKRVGAELVDDGAPLQRVPAVLRKWLTNNRLRSVSNHETRSHIAEDLGRYLFCASCAAARNRAPKSAEFPSALAPKHANWKTGNFSDRFRVQLADQPATTITSHISKDGHHFIHYDPAQCRSLTVREAARAQTFPDDYFFMGPRTEQYHQVGNAVPPYLAKQIANIVMQIIEGISMPIDQSTLTKGQVRKLNALRKSVGDDIAEDAFGKWMTAQSKTPKDVRDPVADELVAALDQFKDDKIFDLGTKGYVVKRSKGKGASGFLAQKIV